MNLKNYLSALEDLPNVLCIQELHLTPKYQPSISYYQVIRKDWKRWWSHGLCQDVFRIFKD